MDDSSFEDEARRRAQVEGESGEVGIEEIENTRVVPESEDARQDSIRELADRREARKSVVLVLLEDEGRRICGIKIAKVKERSGR